MEVSNTTSWRTDACPSSKTVWEVHSVLLIIRSSVSLVVWAVQGVGSSNPFSTGSPGKKFTTINLETP